MKEVVDAHQAGKFRIAAAWATDLGLTKHLSTHLAVQDPSGNSAIIEFVKGKLVIHHGPEYRIMTNDPPYDEMMALTKEYVPFGGPKPLPGDVGAVDRFVRLAEFSRYLPEPKNYVQAVAGALSLLRTAQGRSAIPHASTASRNSGMPSRPIGSARPTSPIASTTSTARRCRACSARSEESQSCEGRAAAVSKPARSKGRRRRPRVPEAVGQALIDWRAYRNWAANDRE